MLVECMFQVYRGHHLCRVASAASDLCQHTTGQCNVRTAWPPKCSGQVGFRDEDACTVRRTVQNQYGVTRSDQQYPANTGIQASVTKFRFQNNMPVEVCDEWYYAVHYLKSAISSIKDSLNDLGNSSDEVGGLNGFARPYRYTSDDIVDIRRLQSPDEGIYLRSIMHDAVLSETCTTMLQEYCETPRDVSTVPLNSNAAGSVAKFLAPTALALGNDVQFPCNCPVSSRSLVHGASAELLKYLDAETFYHELISRLSHSDDSYVLLHCDGVRRNLVLDSSGLLRLDSLHDSPLLSAGTSSGLTPGGSDDRQKLPNIDQLRAIQDNLANNVCDLF